MKKVKMCDGANDVFKLTVEELLLVAKEYGIKVPNKISCKKDEAKVYLISDVAKNSKKLSKKRKYKVFTKKVFKRYKEGKCMK